MRRGIGPMRRRLRQRRRRPRRATRCRRRHPHRRRLLKTWSKMIAHAGAGPAGGELRLATDGEVVAVPRYDAVDIAIDGKLDEAVWDDVPGYDNMVVVEPDTLAPARFRTVARFLYTDRGLYVGVWNEQPPETLIARLSSRDDYINRDSWGLTLDTSGEGLYGYWFNVNLGGSVMDRKSRAGAQLLAGVGRAVGQRDRGDRRRLDGRDVPAVVDDDHAADGRRPGDGFLRQSQGSLYRRALGVACLAVHRRAVHVRVAADRAAGGGAEKSSSRYFPTSPRRWTTGIRGRATVPVRTCSGGHRRISRSRPPRCPISARWSPTMSSSTSPHGKPTFPRSACSSWKAARSSPRPGVPPPRAAVAAAAASRRVRAGPGAPCRPSGAPRRAFSTPAASAARRSSPTAMTWTWKVTGCPSPPNCSARPRSPARPAACATAC